MKDTVTGKTEKASLRKVMFKVSNEPKLVGGRENGPDREKDHHVPSPRVGRSIAGSKN